MFSKYIKRKQIVYIGILVGIIAICSFGIHSIYIGLNGDPTKIEETTKELEEKMEAKYGIIIVNRNSGYSNKDGYVAIFTTDNGIIFSANKRQNSSSDTYMEEIWRYKGLKKWGYVDRYQSNIGEIDLNVGYRDENKKDKKLTQNIEDVKNDLWLTIYIDLKETYQEEVAMEIEKGIYQYYQRLQKDGGSGIVLIVRHKDDTGSYMITKDLNGKLPTISSPDSIKKTYSKD